MTNRSSFQSDLGQKRFVTLDAKGMKRAPTLYAFESWRVHANEP
jgi:hypothetical protein